MFSAFLSLGSNIGDRALFLEKAHALLSQFDQIEIQKVSCIMETVPLINENQPHFLNQVIQIRTLFSPKNLLKKLKEIEKKIGRKKRMRYGPREIDLDILSYENIHLNKADLILPHPALTTRPYLVPLLADIQTTPEKLLQ